ncbi:disulfide bond formation protein DsbB [Algibacillus agarilyticus]|uniref:disulfide bond formation protein DsbB n=1 Tax=Algibacillus agarilyticus TaxID=2234133 RepID=UPI0013004709|nr:disulfide bond formation protein DsbB [Algibacillus agarilyticus]
MLSILNVDKRPLWLILFISALFLEGAALYFQYVLGYEPCVKCIYTRVAVFGFILAGLIGLIAPNKLLVRLLAYGIFVLSLISAFIIAFEHIEVQRNTLSIFAICEAIPNFPEWFQIHIWFPDLFEVRGSCGDVNWEMFSLSMPEWMVVIYSMYTLSFLIVIINRLYQFRTL